MLAQKQRFIVLAEGSDPAARFVCADTEAKQHLAGKIEAREKGFAADDGHTQIH